MLHLARVAGARVLLAAARYILPELSEPEESDAEDWTSVPAPSVSPKGLSMLALPSAPKRVARGEDEPLAGSVASRMRREWP